MNPFSRTKLRRVELFAVDYTVSSELVSQRVGSLATRQKLQKNELVGLGRKASLASLVDQTKPSPGDYHYIQVPKNCEFSKAIFVSFIQQQWQSYASMARYVYLACVLLDATIYTILLTRELFEFVQFVYFFSQIFQGYSPLYKRLPHPNFQSKNIQPRYYDTYGTCTQAFWTYSNSSRIVWQFCIRIAIELQVYGQCCLYSTNSEGCDISGSRHLIMTSVSQSYRQSGQTS